MFARMWMMAAVMSVTAFWSAEAFVGDDQPDPRKKAESGPKDSAKKALKQYHASAVQAFIDTPGFGHDRMPPMLRVIEDLRVDWTSQEVDEDKAQITVPDLAKAHRERIAGYKKEPWARLKLPGNVHANSVEPGNIEHTWRLHRIDLVAIVDHDEPLVYITPIRPSALIPLNGEPRSPQESLLHAQLERQFASKELGKSFRAPNHLELAALDRFRDGEETLVRNKGDVLQMVGALRATKQCLECHKNAKEGDLFGAFSYTLKETSE